MKKAIIAVLVIVFLCFLIFVNAPSPNGEGVSHVELKSFNKGIAETNQIEFDDEKVTSSKPQVRHDSKKKVIETIENTYDPWGWHRGLKEGRGRPDPSRPFSDGYDYRTVWKNMTLPEDKIRRSHYKIDQEDFPFVLRGFTKCFESDHKNNYSATFRIGGKRDHDAPSFYIDIETHENNKMAHAPTSNIFFTSASGFHYKYQGPEKEYGDYSFVGRDRLYMVRDNVMCKISYNNLPNGVSVHDLAKVIDQQILKQPPYDPAADLEPQQPKPTKTEEEKMKDYKKILRGLVK